MPNIKRTFLAGKLNKDIDERILPEGQYRDALNVRVSSSEGSDVGAIENSLGNEKLTSLGLTNGKTIGGFADDSNQKLYLFITSDTKDLVIEYDTKNDATTVLLESTSLLNFDSSYRITGVVKIINGDSDRDLLVWTDDRNAPRMINIERAKTYAVDGFIEDDISLIKKPPRFAPDTTLSYTTSTLENNIENKFISFAYRYKYLDGGYSALSSFTRYEFSPNKFNIDYSTMENDGMINSFNAVDIDFNTGSERVIEVELVFKESNSNTIYLIEAFNKENKGWGDDETQSYLFSNSKIARTLPEDELFRRYDNVPRLAKALDIIGNRVVFGNYVEQYNLTTIDDKNINLDYDLNLSSASSLGEELVAFSAKDTWFVDQGGNGISGVVLWFDIGDNTLTKDAKLTFEFTLDGIISVTKVGAYTHEFSYILQQDYNDVGELATDPDFENFIENVWTTHYESDYTATAPDDSTIDSTTDFSIDGYDATEGYIIIKAPTIDYLIDNTIDPPYHEILYWKFKDSTMTVSFNTVSINSSLKSNRSYEVGIVYLDEHNRSTTVLTTDTNDIFIPVEQSTSQNKLQVILNNNYPSWADRYKFAVKQNKLNYHTIYANIFYQEGLFRWVKLEGANKDKVHEGDVLIVKSDLGGAVEELVKVRVLEVKEQEENFLTPSGEDVNDQDIEEAGLYMKIKPSDFDMNFNDLTVRTFEGHEHARYPNKVYAYPALLNEYSNLDFISDNYDPTEGTLMDLLAGSKVEMYIKFEGRKAIEFKHEYEQTFPINSDYLATPDVESGFKKWFEAEVVDLGQFGIDYTRDINNPDGEHDEHTEGLYDDGTHTTGVGYGFYDTTGKYFYVHSWRKGTNTRAVTTTLKIKIYNSAGTCIFETESVDSDSEVFYETEQTFELDPVITQAGGGGEIYANHYGNIQNQARAKQSSGTLTVGKVYKLISFETGDDFSNVGATNTEGETFTATGTTPTVWSNASLVNQPAVVELDFFNCYVQGNGAESYRYKDAFIYGTDSIGTKLEAKYLNIDLRPTAVSKEPYKEVRRYADLTYSESYNENNNLNGLNEFNLSKSNYKEDIDKKYGFIQKLYSRDTNLVLFQEDKVSQVLYGKDLLMNADGTSNVTSIENVLGQQIPYAGEYGISRNPESFAFYGNNVWFTDAKRGCVLRLGADGITEISAYGMKDFYRDLFDQDIDSFKVGAYDPWHDQYTLTDVLDTDDNSETITYSESVKGWTSRHSFKPEFSIKVNNRFYTTKDGELWIHNSENVPRNNFYGAQYNSKITTVINAEPSEDKIFKTIVLEGTHPWAAQLDTNYTSSDIYEDEFNRRESKWFAYTRKSLINEDLTSVAQGIGTIVSSDGLTVTFDAVPVSINIGDELHQVNGNVPELIGIITDITDNIVTVEEVINTPVDTVFGFTKKDSRIEGAEIRGYYLKVELESDETEPVELFAINTNAVKSFV